MAKIICNIQLGLAKQQLFIIGQKYNNKKTIETYELILKDIAPFISDNEDITQVYIKGPPAICHIIEEDTKNLEIIKYSKKKTHFIYE